MTARPTLSAAASLIPTMLIPTSSHGDDDPDDDVPRVRLQRLPEDREVVRNEDRRDRDRDHVVQHLRPRRPERDELVERVPGEARRAARLRKADGPLGVGRGGRREDQPADDEDERREPERDRRRERRARSRSTSRRCRRRSRTARACRARARARGSVAAAWAPGPMLRSGGDGREKVPGTGCQAPVQSRPVTERADTGRWRGSRAARTGAAASRRSPAGCAAPATTRGRRSPASRR